MQTAEDLLEVSRAFVVDPARIMCPLLILIGKNEYHQNISSREWVEETVQKVGEPVQLCVVPANEGMNSHTTGTNLSLMS